MKKSGIKKTNQLPMRSLIRNRFFGKFNLGVVPKHMIALLVIAMLFFSKNTNAGAFTASGSTLTLDLNVASQLPGVVANGTTYSFTLGGGATNARPGTTG